MKKADALKFIDDLIEDEKEAVDMYNKGIEKMSDSQSIVSLLGELYREETMHITRLIDLKDRIETRDERIALSRRDALFGMGPVCCDHLYEGLHFDEDDEGEND